MLHDLITEFLEERIKNINRLKQEWQSDPEKAREFNPFFIPYEYLAKSNQIYGIGGNNVKYYN